ncbi:hypothetical protein Sjap_006349 [Stephania japonica]|uniref:RWD domain-containing protein n=1 Tax=Stephania japonica TaxID=461633 RepID=A0AAP0K5M2_9MAGN
MAQDEEVDTELEAVQAVYGDDCRVIRRFPPHLHVHIKPRTADDSSQQAVILTCTLLKLDFMFSLQFVEAWLELCANSQYPEEPPHIGILESKGLDEKRRMNLIACIKEKACELSSYLMLVALCEEAVELLTNMNHPDGNCPLCLYPLVKENACGDSIPFMKLMSCFHCFHCKCFISWWNWLQERQENDGSYSYDGSIALSRNPQNQLDLLGTLKENCGSCPMCRKVFHAKDIEHVLSIIENFTSRLCLDGTESEEDEEILQSEAEHFRKQKLETITKLQEDNNGLIKAKRDLVLMPGMFLPEPIIAPAEASAEVTSEQQTESGCPSTSETDPSMPLHNPSNSECRNSSIRKDKFHYRRRSKTNRSKR